MKVRIALTLYLALAASPAFACSIIGFRFFEPNPSAFEPKYDDEDDSRVLMPAPIPKIFSVHRGSTSSGDECSDFGFLEVEIAWPADSPYTLDEVGFYFRVVTGTDAVEDSIFPDRPVVGTLDRNRILFTWLDGHPSRQKALEGKVEVFAVNDGLQIGPSAYFEFKVLPDEHRGPPL
jgi:hypothetical protein